MSDTKPSRAARELSVKAAISIRKRYDVGIERNGIFNQLLNNSGLEEVIAQAVDSALADMLEKAEASLEHLENGGYYETHRDLKSALEPWKPGE